MVSTALNLVATLTLLINNDETDMAMEVSTLIYSRLVNKQKML